MLTCGSGTWNSNTGSLSIAACEKCGQGKYSTATGAASEENCNSCSPGKASGSLGAETSAPGWDKWNFDGAFIAEEVYASLIASVQNYALRMWAIQYLHATTVSMYFWYVTVLDIGAGNKMN